MTRPYTVRNAERPELAFGIDEGTRGPPICFDLVLSNYWMDVCFWHLTDKPPAPEFVAYWTDNGQKAALGLDLSAVIDPTATLAVHCGNGFDPGFSRYQSTRLTRYGVSCRD